MNKSNIKILFAVVTKHPAPNTIVPDTIHQTPETRRQTPDTIHQTPETRCQRLDARHQTPDNSLLTNELDRLGRWTQSSTPQGLTSYPVVTPSR